MQNELKTIFQTIYLSNSKWNEKYINISTVKSKILKTIYHNIKQGLQDLTEFFYNL